MPLLSSLPFSLERKVRMAKRLAVTRFNATHIFKFSGSPPCPSFPLFFEFPWLILSKNFKNAGGSLAEIG